MPDHISGKVIVLTGASSGIGRETALLLAARGAAIVCGARRMDRIERLREEIGRAGGRCAIRQTDVSRAEEVEALVALAVSEFGRVDVLINNAADTTSYLLKDADRAVYDRQIDTNIKGPLSGITAVLPHMLAQGSGHIINIGSMLSFSVIPKWGVYAATKYALRALSEAIRIEAGPPVRSTLIMPGAVATEVQSDVSYHISAEDIARMIIFAIDQPADVDINELVVRPTRQPH